MVARRRLAVEGLALGWDLGGLERRSGGTTPFGVFFRSAAPDRVTTSGWDAIHAAGIRTIVDLRRDDELPVRQPVRPAGIGRVHVDLDGFDNVAFWAEYRDSGRFGTALYYLAHLEAMPERAVRALTAIVSAPPGGVLFHCGGGRDRTGLISMLLLAAVGVTVDAAVADYLAVVAGATSLGGARLAAGESSLDEICARYGTTTEGAFRQAAEALDLGRVLEAGGMDPAAHAALSSWRGAVGSA